jgi:tripartite-type tricarboxylate transporter receptor subunit TctC
VVAPPKKTDPITARLAQAISEVAHEPSFQDRLSRIGCALAFKPPGEFASYIAEERSKWSRIIPAMGIKIEE